MALTLTALGLSAVLGLAGCGVGATETPRAASGDPVALGDLADEAYALRAVGFETGLEGAPAPSAAASAPGDRGDKREGRRHAGRRFLRKNILHGEMTVQGRDGVRTIVVQRGTVIAADGRTVSVKSADGFALTWTYGDRTRVVQDRKKAQLSVVTAGAEIGLAGTRQGTATTARLIVVS